MNKYVLSFLLIISLCWGLHAGDTIRVMHYNLLYYDLNTSWCTSSNNNVDLKDGYLRDITGYYKPDIFTVNEMNGSHTSVQRLLDNVFNQGGENKYKRANYTGSYLVNMLYYNSEKLELKSQSYILTEPRLSDIYRLYYKSESLSKGDTVFLTCIVTHLKAGSGDNDAQRRAAAAQQIMNHINNQNLQGNIMLMGDFNVYTSTEVAFQTFLSQTTSGMRFYDPVDAIGSWHDNPQFRHYHTQSTYVSGNCPSGGGMDDRFDFILTSNSILEGSAGLEYVDDSYWAFGQDGNRLNQSLINPPNYSLPNNIINSLYSMSDHLPVVLKLFVEQEPLGVEALGYKENFRVSNPFSESIILWKLSRNPEKVNIRIMNILGTVVHEENAILHPGKQKIISSSGLSNGIYLILFQGEKTREIKRIIKQ